MRRLLIAASVVALLTLGAYLFVRAVLASDLVRSTIEAQLAERLGQPVRVGTARAVLFPRVAIDLGGIEIGTPATVRLERVRIATGLRGLISRVVADAEVAIDGGRIGVPLAFSLPAPQAPGPPGTPPSGGIAIQSVQSIAVRDVTLSGGGQDLLLDMESSLAGDRLEIRQLSARTGRTRITASGTISSLERLEGTFDATADPFDFGDIVAVASGLSGNGGGTEAGPPRAMHLVVKFTAPEGRFGTFAFRDLGTTLDLTPGRLRFDPLSVRAFGGGFAGTLAVLSDKAAPLLRLDGKLTGLDVAALLAASGSPGGITGRLAGSISLAGSGPDAVALVNSSRGRIDAAVTDGNIPGLDMVRTIVLAFGKPAGAPPEGSGSAFSRLGGSFALANGLMRSTDLRMESRDFDLTGEGALRLSSGRIEGRADVMLSPELTAQAGTDLRRYAQQNGRVIVPATFEGTLQRPKVSLDIEAAARRALGNELKRRATSILEDLFKKKKK